MECTHFQPYKMQSNYHVVVLKSMYPSLSFSSFQRLQALGALKISFDVPEISDFDNSFRAKDHLVSIETQSWNKEVQIDGNSEFPRSLSNIDHTEMERRRKIGLANKGKVPWNKGIKRTAETRELIRQKTIEALRDPKVRKKMSEHPRPHSDQIKAKISLSLRRVWGERLKWRQLREKFYLSWAQSIAESAKEGGNGQEELDWDSYDKIQQEIALQKLQESAEKANAKEMAKIKREQRKYAKAEKVVSLDQKRNDREEKAKERGRIKRKTRRKPRGEKKESEVSEDLKLKQRLKKIHRRKSKVQVTSQGSTEISHIPAWEKLDLELVKREKVRIEVSLADQIRAAKNRRAEYAAMGAVAVPTSMYSSSQKLEE